MNRTETIAETFLSGRVALHAGDCLDVLATLPENSIDSVVCDPPYHLTSIVKRFGADNAAPAKSNGATGVYRRASAGFMGKRWDGGDTAFQPETWAAVLRVMKPGAHLLAFGGTRTFARMAVAIEDAGFDVRDTIMWLYGSGFPKSLDISKAIDKAAGAERERIRGVRSGVVANTYAQDAWSLEYKDSVLSSEPITDAARRWDGFGTALKPACEPIVLARKPLSERTVAANVLRWGTGALNVDGCRVGTEESTVRNRNSAFGLLHHGRTKQGGEPGIGGSDNGRWPANVITDGSDEVVGMFPDSAGQQGDVRGSEPSSPMGGSVFGRMDLRVPAAARNDTGSAARFFYSAKADSDDRIGSKHPTVKPVDLIQYLTRLVTPPGGTVLDLFAGTGTTGEAAFREGFRAILIEREPEYQDDIRRRMALVLAGPDERARESIKARNKDKPVDPGPLFGAEVGA